MGESCRTLDVIGAATKEPTLAVEVVHLTKNEIAAICDNHVHLLAYVANIISIDVNRIAALLWQWLLAILADVVFLARANRCRNKRGSGLQIGDELLHLH